MVAPALVLLACALAQQDDFAFAEALADRAYFDLAEEVFQSIAANSRLPQEKRAEGELGLARLKVRRARRERSAEAKLALIQQARTALEEFQRSYPNHPRRSEAVDSLAEIDALEAKAYADQARRDPEAAGHAREALARAETSSKATYERLERAEPQGDPESDEYHHWEAEFYQAAYNYTSAMFSFCEVLRDFEAYRPEVLEHLQTIVTFVDDFTWKHEGTAVAYVLAAYAGRAAWMEAELGPAAEAEAHWRSAWNFFNMIAALANDPAIREHPDGAAIVGEGVLWMVRARIAYAQGLARMDPPGANRIFEEAAAKADEICRIFRGIERQDTGKGLRIEQGRALLLAGRRDEATRVLERVISDSPDTPFGAKAIELLAGAAGESNPQLLLQAGESHVRRGRYLEAAASFRRAVELLPVTQTSERARCWLRIGQCYHQVGLFEEAIACYGVLVSDPSMERLEAASQAAILRYNAARTLEREMESPRYVQLRERLEREGMEKYPSAFGDQTRINRAIAEEKAGRFQEAIALYSQIRPGQLMDKALAGVARCTYRLAQAEREANGPRTAELARQAAQALRGHIEAFSRLQEPDASSTRNAMYSIDYLTYILSTGENKNPEEVLRVTDGFLDKFGAVARNGRGRDPEVPVNILRRRFDAACALLDPANAVPTATRAETEIEALLGYVEQYAIGTEARNTSLNNMSARMENFAGQVADPDIAAELRQKADLYFTKYLQAGNSATGVTDPPEMRRIATRLWKRAQASGDRQTAGLARNVFQGYLSAVGTTLSPRDATAVQLAIASCFRIEGNMEQAVEILDQLALNDPDRRDVYLRRELAQALEARGNQRLQSGQRDSGIEDLRRASQDYMLGFRLRQQSPRTDDPRETEVMAVEMVLGYLRCALRVSPDDYFSAANAALLSGDDWCHRFDTVLDVENMPAQSQDRDAALAVHREKIHSYRAQFLTLRQEYERVGTKQLPACPGAGGAPPEDP